MSADDAFDLSDELEDFHEEHVDERWLISYADMMTLLFGLFVMLYAMTDNFEAVQRSAAKQFGAKGASASVPETPKPADVTQTQLETLQKERAELMVKVATLEAAVKAEPSRGADVEKLLAEKETLKEALKQQQAEMTKISAITSERDELKRQLAEKNIVVAEEASKKEAKSGGEPVHYTVSATLPDGSKYVTRTIKATLGGMQVEQVPPSALGRTFKLTLSKQSGESVQVTVRVAPGLTGGSSRRLQILGFDGEDEDTFKEWIGIQP